MNPGNIRLYGHYRLQLENPVNCSDRLAQHNGERVEVRECLNRLNDSDEWFFIVLTSDGCKFVIGNRSLEQLT